MSKVKLFASHSHRDKPTVTKLIEYSPSGFEWWEDTRELPAGEPLRKSIEKAIDNDCTFFVIFLGQESITSKAVQEEFKRAYKRSQDIGLPIVIPILLGNVELKNTVFADLEEIVYIKVGNFDDTGLREAASRLHDTITAHLSRMQSDGKPGAKEQLDAAIDSLSAINEGISQFNEIAYEWCVGCLTQIEADDVSDEEAMKYIEHLISQELDERRSTLEDYRESLRDESRDSDIGGALLKMGLALNMPQQEIIVKILEKLQYIWTIFANSDSDDAAKVCRDKAVQELRERISDMTERG